MIPPAGKRAPLLALALLALCGCAGARTPRERPAAVAFAFADGFHSGLILDRADLPPGFDPQPQGEPASWPWVAVHFGELHWMSGEADGVWDALKLAAVPGPGGVQCDHLPGLVSDCGGTDPARMRSWAFLLDETDLRRLHARLWTWADPGRVVRRTPASPTWAYGARRDWSLWCNCHDFTADLLDAIGVAVDRPPVMLATGLADGLDRAWADEQAVAVPLRPR